MPTPEQIIEHFGLKPLPVEGGLYIQTYRSSETLEANCLPARFDTSRPYGTAIVYLFTTDSDSFSAVHSLPTDEVFHFYLGDPVELLHLYPDGSSEVIELGQDLLNGQKVQHVVPRGVWQASRLKSGGKWALVGTTMAPGFSHEDYLGGDAQELVQQYPERAEYIQRLTRPDEPLRRMPETD